MYLMYVDESGDVGTGNSPTRYFILSGLVIHELRWREALSRLVDFRKRMRDDYGLKLREEVHAIHLFRKPGDLARIPKHNRLAIMRHYLDTLAQVPGVNFVNVVVDKNGMDGSHDVFDLAWRNLIQRFENTISYGNFPGPRFMNTENTKRLDRGLIFADDTDAVKLRGLLRKMRYYNPVPSRFGGFRNLVLDYIIEDVHHRNSMHSYFIQSVDVVAYSVQQSLAPNKYMREKGGANFFRRLDSKLCKVASSDPLGLVWAKK